MVQTAGTLTTGSLTNVATVGTVSNVAGGSIVVTAGTVTTSLVLNNGTIDLLKAGTITRLEGGTLGIVAAGSMVQTAGTLTTGSLTNLATLGTIANLNTGTIAVVAAGSHVHTAGTLTTGTLQNLVSGTINAGSVVLNSGTMTTGSLTNLATVGTISNIAGGTVTVSNPSGGPTGPKFSYQTSAALAAAATGTLSFTAITNAKTGQLNHVIVSSSVPIRAQIDSVDDAGTGTATAAVLFTSAAHLVERFDSPADNYFTRTSTGTAKFQAVIKNNDNALAADIYASCFWDEITT